MHQISLALIAGTFVLLLGVIQLVLLRVFNTVWWRSKWIRRTSIYLLLSTFLFAGLWALAAKLNQTALVSVFALGTSIAAVLNLTLIFGLPLSGLINTAMHWYTKWRTRAGNQHSEEPKSIARRQAIQKLAAVFPVAAIALGTDGITRSYGGCNVEVMPFYFDNLPHQLEGLKILHVSDIHLGPYIDLHDVEKLMIKAEALKPDLMLISGDISDDLSQLDSCIKLLEGLKPPLGSFASMGNHDYFRGASQVIASFDKSSIPMLIDKGVTIKANGVDLFVGGADDPRHMGSSNDDFLTRTVDKTLEGAPSDGFKIVMSHRPSGFKFTSRHDVQLTLAGHTHGGQIGFMGRSIFTTWGGEQFIWGHYTIGKSQLYTSSGVGHWFPFRLGCPTEAPLIVLKQGVNPQAAVQSRLIGREAEAAVA